jgi:hypothetical protein
MTKEELKGLLGNKPSLVPRKIMAKTLANLTRFVDVTIRINSETLDYYYEIDADDLVNSKLPREEYDVLKDQGWSLVENKIIIYLTI